VEVSQVPQVLVLFEQVPEVHRVPYTKEN